MGKYFSKKFLFIFLFFTITFHQIAPNLPEQTRYPDHPLYSMYTNPWRFMEQVFIIEPELELNKKFPQVLQMVAATFGAVPGSVWFVKQAWNPIKEFCNQIFSENQRIYPSLNKNLILHSIGSLGLTVLLSYLLYIIMHKSFERKAYGNVLKNFVITWPNNKEHTPPILHDLFSFINKEYIASASEDYLKGITPDIIARIHQAIYEKYPEKYNEKLLQTNGLPRWLKWTIVALSTAVILKIAASATKDFLAILENKNIVNLIPVSPERIVNEKKTIEDFNNHMAKAIENKAVLNEVVEVNKVVNVDDGDEKKKIDAETLKAAEELFKKCWKEVREGK